MVPPTTDVVELTREEIVSQLERGARERRDMSAAEFARAYRRGDLAQPCEDAELRALVFLLPEDDPLFDGLQRG